MRTRNPNNRLARWARAVWLVCVTSGSCSLALADTADLIDFDTQIVPILSKAGCNAAACHGGAAGRGGFRLSLFGGDPVFDYRSIVLELEGRRINYREAADSLIVAKPTEMLEHGGGQRLEAQGELAQTLTSWIVQGAQRRQLRRLKDINVRPASPRFDKLPARFAFSVEAEFDDRTRTDVTRLARYSANDKASVEVDERGNANVLRPGRHAILVSFCDQTAPVIVTAPFATPLETTDFARHNWVDDVINDTLASLGLKPAGPIDDMAFVRRVRLDLTGRLPTPEQLREFAADARADKRARLVDELLSSDAFVEFWTYRLARLLRARPPGNDMVSGAAFRSWIQDCVRADTSWSTMVAEMLTGTGDSHVVGPANMHRLTADAREQAEYVSEVFMGVTLRCANCHNHPLDRWRQDDYHGLAQLFARVERGQIVGWGERGDVTHPISRLPATARIPAGQPVEQLDQGRQLLAEWLAEADNPYFAKALVNRLWKAMLGRGLFEPATDLRATNPPTHPVLLERLADSFRDSDYRIRPLLRLLANSLAYQRSCRDEYANSRVTDGRFYTSASAKSMEAEVLADAISDVLGIPSRYGDQPLGTRAIALLDPDTPSIALDVLGRCASPTRCDLSSTAPAEGIAAQLGLLNGPALNERLKSNEGTLSRMLASDNDPQIVRECYLSALSRSPTEEEASWWVQALAAAGKDQRREFLEDFLWSLLTSREFAHVN